MDDHAANSAANAVTDEQIVERLIELAAVGRITWEQVTFVPASGRAYAGRLGGGETRLTLYTEHGPRPMLIISHAGPGAGLGAGRVIVTMSSDQGNELLRHVAPDNVTWVRAAMFEALGDILQNM